MTRQMPMVLLAATLAAAALAACDGGDAKTEPTASAKATVAPTEPKSAAVTTSAASASTPPTPAASSAPAALASSSAAIGDGGSVACGKPGLPFCPLQGWMKANIAEPSENKDFPALAAALDTIVKFAPAGYTNWVSIAKDGAKAARDEKLDGVRAACRACHTQYKEKYRAELRTRKI